VRLTEILKQGQFHPLPVEKQILIIYAGNRGFLDEFPVSRIPEYERKLEEYFAHEKSAVLAAIVQRKQIDNALDAEISAALTEFNARFREQSV